ncbi:hypothetical protein [Rhizobium ruizarguesonis]|uniref:hypothetical protein n=1 Tax=Rhizobium ruizarguesonis TaxID=2081791 RepID=UPI001444B057|nr:hypothetical protein [Rhizobium ruizarguesonis]NKQ88178.1 hypothetical protein [Rhizobium ruizarguesonis]
MGDKNDLDKLSTEELGRRLLADIEEAAVEFELHMGGIGQNLHRAEEQLRIEAMGMTPKHFDDDELIKLEDALYLPILGGETLRNGDRTASRTFTKASLELAIKKGELEAIWKHNKLHVTLANVTKWATRSETGRKSSSPIKQHVVSNGRTHLEKSEGRASVALASDRLAALSARLSTKKRGK